MNIKNYLYAFVISHKSVPQEIRQLFSLSQDEIKELIAKFKQIYEIKGVVVLSTCNRTEFYFSLDFGHTKSSTIISKIEQLIADQKKQSITLLRSSLLSYVDYNAITHLYKVISGLDSAILGENEIFQQVKEAYQLAKECDSVDFSINTIFQKGFSCAKEIKSCEEFKSHSTSYATLIASKIIHFSDQPKNVFIIGSSGVIGSQIIKKLSHYDNINILAAVHRHRSVNAHVVNLIDYDDRYTGICWADVIVSVSSSPHYTITYNKARECLNNRKPRLFIDGAVPNDIDPMVKSLDQAQLINLDYLNDLIDNNKQQLLSGVTKGEEIIEHAVDQVLKTILFRNFIHDHKELIDDLSNYDCNRLLYNLKDHATADELMAILSVLKKFNE